MKPHITYVKSMKSWWCGRGGIIDNGREGVAPRRYSRGAYGKTPKEAYNNMMTTLNYYA